MHTSATHVRAVPARPEAETAAEVVGMEETVALMEVELLVGQSYHRVLTPVVRPDGVTVSTRVPPRSAAAPRREAPR